MTEPPNDVVDEANNESFPASDPPTWSGSHAGPPNGARTSPAVATLRSVRSAFPVEQAILRVERAVVAAGMKVFARIDHAAEARAIGAAMRPAVVLLFGNPTIGTPLMVARPTVALDLPLRALVWEDHQGEHWLTYNTLALMTARHDLSVDLVARLAPVGDLLEKAVRS